MENKDYIAVSLLGSGYAAIHMTFVKDEGDKHGYWDVQQTGIGRYSNKEEAEKEAKLWAEAEEMEYRE